MSRAPRSVIVVGAGVVGAACAEALARAGVRVQVLEAGGAGGGATAACMGHIVVLDDSEAQLALTLRGRELWGARAADWPPLVGPDTCGTLWVAADAEEFAGARAKHEWFAARGVATELVDAAQLARLEPNLRRGLAGGLRVPEDSVVYPPVATRAMLDEAVRRGAEVREHTPVRHVAAGRVELLDGGVLEADVVLVAAGLATPRLVDCADLVVRAKKGHLAITDRCPDFVHHQLIELGYLKSAHGTARESVAFNVQPRRASGQVLLGSSRQVDDDEPGVEPHLLAKMVARGVEFLPGLAALPVIRVWVGFRPSTDDNLPVLGPVPGDPCTWLATGHEGTGITTSLASAELLTARLLGHEPLLDPEPYDTARLGTEVAHG